ncbi:MAG: hypothetical protein KDB86_14420 [Actinobacteria bacterium]|nr:hypothetical protein [Actinomycetota bacterium]
MCESQAMSLTGVAQSLGAVRTPTFVYPDNPHGPTHMGEIAPGSPIKAAS